MDLTVVPLIVKRSQKWIIKFFFFLFLFFNIKVESNKARKVTEAVFEKNGQVG